MGRFRRFTVAAVTLALATATAVPQAVASPFDGFAGAAVGFALGAMAARQRGTYYAPRYRRAATYRSRPVIRRHYAATPVRRHAPASRGGSGFAVSSASDPFAGAKATPASAH